MSFSLSNFSLRAQIGLSGLLGLLGLIVIGAIAAMSDYNMSRFEATMVAASAQSNLRQDISTGLLQARRAEKDFQLRRSADYGDRHAKIMAGVLGSVDKLAAATTEPSKAARIAEVKAGVAKYQAEFQALVQAETSLGLNETLGLQGALRSTVQAIERTLNEFSTPELSVLMLMMRRHEKDFQLRLRPTYGEDMTKRAAEFAKALATSSIPAATQADISAKMAAYHRDFAALLKGTLGAVEAARTMSATYAKMEPVLDSMDKQIDAELESAKTSLDEVRSWTRQLTLGTIIATILLVGPLTIFIGMRVSSSVTSIAGAMTDLSGGNKAVVVPHLNRKDEVGAMAGALEVFKRNLIETDRLRVEQEELKKQAETEKRQAMLALADDFDRAVGGVVNMVSSGATEMRATAESLSAAAEQTSRQSTSVATASEEATSNVQTVASAAEELSSSIAEISRQVQHSSTIAAKAVEGARKTDTTVQGLAEAANKIGEVVKLINGIASQTNLLALNATIEAARAGEAGKGFAVVASEVKNLAAQTAKATEEIAQQINAIQSSTGDAVTAIKGIGATIGEISQIATTIAAAVEEQGAATQEIARNVQQAAAGTQEVSANISGVTQAAQSTGAAAEQMLGSSGELSQQSEKLRAEVDNFLARVRAA